MTHYEALRIEEANDDAVMGLVSRRLGVCGSSAPPTGLPAAAPTAGQAEPPVRHCFKAAEVYAIERGRLAGTLRVVREAIRSLGRTPGRKSLVLVTTGFPVDPSVSVFREVRDHAARANVAVATSPTTTRSATGVCRRTACWRVTASSSSRCARPSCRR